jgi:hypothetical protein
MKRPGIIPFWVLVALMAATMGLIVASPGASKAAPVGTPQQQGQPQLEYFTRTLETVTPASGGGASFGWVRLSIDWVGYGLAQIGCGHCGLYTPKMGFQNVLTGQKLTIKSATWGYQSSSGGRPEGVQTVQMFAPFVVWTQPGKTVPGQGYTFSPGDYDCTVCYYDLSTGKGGAVASLQSLDPDGRTTLDVMDVNSSGQVLAKLDGSSNLFVGTIGKEGLTQIATGLPPGAVNEAVFALFGRYVWQAGDTIYINDPQGPGGKQVGKGKHLIGRGLYFFWHNAEGIQTYDGDVVGPNPKPAGRTVVPGASERFDVQTTTDLGDIATWTALGQDGNWTLNVVNFSVAGGTNKLLTRTQRAPYESPALASDKLVFIETQYTTQLPIYYLQLVWLAPADPAFAQVWKKADEPVAQGKAARSWLWGPQANYMGKEQYVEGQNGRRLVRYYDKSRMEVNNPNGDKKDPYYVTNGLLVTEMIAGEIQIGNSTFITASVPCTIPVAGDPRKDNPLTPSYDALKGVSSLHGDNKAPNRVGQQVDGGMDVNGTVSIDNAHKNLSKYAAYSPQTSHNIPDLFWDYLQKMQSTYGFDWTFVLGYPVSEAYWTQMRVGGEDLPVMIQAYQRRVLTYVPAFDPNWRVQMGNVGQHYFEWRYVLNK